MTPSHSTMLVGIRACIYVVLGVGTLVGVIPALIADLAPGPLFLLGLPIMLTGLVIYLWTAWDFVSVGRGTPLPIDPPRTLVIHGLYRVVRNPMALGFLLILIGEAVAFGALPILAYAAVLFLVIHLFIVFVEEPDLKRRFVVGSQASLCSDVRPSSRPPGPCLLLVPHAFGSSLDAA